MDNSVIVTKGNGDANEMEKKHLKYKEQYVPNKLFWGLGIENEVYLEFENKCEIKEELFIKSCRRERYSVNYFENYKHFDFIKALKHFIHGTQKVKLPVLMNSHSFTKTDKYNNPKTMYSKLSEPNPKFVGETLLETLQEENEYFRNNIDKEWLFDGDTFEFNTLKFYNTTLQEVVGELTNHKKTFITNLNDIFKQKELFREHGEIKIMENNHSFATFMTNYKNVSIFNNGTLHYNLTLPTELDENLEIKDMPKFIHDHKKGIKMIQWMEPFMVAVYGTPDPFADMKNYPDKHKFSHASQRSAVSRYISIGTYNTDEMLKGKLLSNYISRNRCNDLSYWWFHEYYKDNSYTKLEEIGYDINFNKHYNHGIEVRFLEHIKEKIKMFEAFEFIVYLMDYILDNDDIDNFGNPIMDKIWNGIVLNTFVHGKDYELKKNEKELYEKIFKFKIRNKKMGDIYHEIYYYLLLKYNNFENTHRDNIYKLQPIGKFSKQALKPQVKVINIKYLPQYENKEGEHHQSFFMRCYNMIKNIL
jgi:hypothetical protein